MPTISVMSPLPVTVITGLEATQPGLVRKSTEREMVVSGLLFSWKKGLQLKFTVKLQCGFPRRILSNEIWLTIRAL